LLVKTLPVVAINAELWSEMVMPGYLMSR